MTVLPPVEWIISHNHVPYEYALCTMEARVKAIHEGTARELVWLLEHPPLYTAGTSAQLEDLRDPQRFPVFKTGRGGQYTYHGPGQRVAYVMLDLTRRGRDVRKFVANLEDWIIASLAAFNVEGERREGRVGVWVDQTSSDGALREDKIAAIGIRLRRWISFHGISLNVEPDLSHFDGITPCGIDDPHLGVTSLVALGRPVILDDVDAALQVNFKRVFDVATEVLAPETLDIIDA